MNSDIVYNLELTFNDKDTFEFCKNELLKNCKGLEYEYKVKKDDKNNDVLIIYSNSEMGIGSVFARVWASFLIHPFLQEAIITDDTGTYSCLKDILRFDDRYKKGDDRM